MRGAEEQAALQLENHRGIALLLENCISASPPGRRALADEALAPHDVAADLLAQEEDDRQNDADRRGGDQADK